MNNIFDRLQTRPYKRNKRIIYQGDFKNKHFIVLTLCIFVLFHLSKNRPSMCEGRFFDALSVRIPQFYFL